MIINLKEQRNGRVQRSRFIKDMEAIEYVRIQFQSLFMESGGLRIHDFDIMFINFDTHVDLHAASCFLNDLATIGHLDFETLNTSTTSSKP